ncbi:prolyl 4-hydroxylase 1-like, partial [Gastrolobium bilobum]|uniref:prolyl 4-hydroxylase 1-like n=1 Tax=Gastrolobium bilobum TaxID=150636 RepID=UPI002AB20FBB
MASESSGGLGFVIGAVQICDLGTESFPFRRLRGLEGDGYLQLPRGIPHWNNDKEAEILRLGYVKPEVLSWSPRIILLHNFLSMEECDYLRAIALPRLQVSTVLDTKTGKKICASGKGIKSDFRTSFGMALSPKERKYPMVHDSGQNPGSLEDLEEIFAYSPVSGTISVLVSCTLTPPDSKGKETTDVSKGK